MIDNNRRFDDAFYAINMLTKRVTELDYDHPNQVDLVRTFSYVREVL